MRPRYIDPFTDFGFKKLFGEEASKELLMDFLMALLPDMTIVNLRFRDKAKLGRTEEDRSSIFDLYCEGANGELFIVELQKAKQQYFRDRMVYYASFPIQEQAESGTWDYGLKPVICVGILDFVFEENKKDSFPAETVQTVMLKDQHNQVFYHKLRFVFVEMPRFTKQIHELESRLDQWLYFIKHLERFESIPEIFKDKIFSKALHQAEIAKYDRQQLAEYDQSLKGYRDMYNTIDYAFKKGREEERERSKKEMKELEERKNKEIEEERERNKREKEEELGRRNREIAQSLKDKGLPWDFISSTTGLSLEEIKIL